MDIEPGRPTTDPTRHEPPRTSRRGLLLGGAALGAGAAIAPLAASPAAAVTGTMAVVTANIKQTLTWDEFIVDLDRAAFGADLLGVNEAYKWRPQLAYWAAVRGFHIFQAEGPQANSGTNVLLARASRFEPRNPPVTGFEVANPGGPGERKPLPTYVNWAVWRELATGIEVFHLNTHTTRGIEKGGRPDRSSADGRVEIAAQQLRRVGALADFVRNGGIEVVVTGDLNVDWKKDQATKDEHFPYAILERGGRTSEPGLRSCFSMFGTPGAGTLGRRHIDYVYEWVRVPKKRRIAMTGVQIVDLLKSDHDAVRTTFALSSGGYAGG